MNQELWRMITLRGGIMARKAKGRSLGDFKEFLSAELELLKACAEGNFAEIQSGRPTEKLRENVVRAGFLRFLMLGGRRRLWFRLKGRKATRAQRLSATRAAHRLIGRGQKRLARRAR
jgi:hypothetical protein